MDSGHVTTELSCDWPAAVRARELQVQGALEDPGEEEQARRVRGQQAGRRHQGSHHRCRACRSQVDKVDLM